MTLRPLLLALLTLAVIATVLPANASAAVVPLQASVDGPTALAPSQTAQYNVTIAGGPTDNVTYTVSYFIEGTNTTGGNPVRTAPGTTSGNRTAYRINVTAPTAEQTITLQVTVTASPKSAPAENATATWTITVIKGIVLSATFHNSGTTAAVNVTVTWYIDGSVVGTSLLKQVSANADATATFTYLPVGLSSGAHTLTASADLDHDGVIEPGRGEVVTTTIFYNQVQPTAPGWAILLGIGVFIPVFLAVVAFRRRGER